MVASNDCRLIVGRGRGVGAGVCVAEYVGVSTTADATELALLEEASPLQAANMQRATKSRKAGKNCLLISPPSSSAARSQSGPATRPLSPATCPSRTASPEAPSAGRKR